MSTTTTPLMGLIKPDRAEPVANWPWQNLINSMILDNKVKAQFLTYTPTLTASGGNPNLGSGGEIEGKYIRFANRLIILYGRFMFGSSGISVGDGRYEFSLPVDADSTLHNSVTERAFDIAGRFVFRDDSSTANTHVGSTEIESGNSTVSFVYGYQAGDYISHQDPVTPASGDSVSFYCMYQEAPL